MIKISHHSSMEQVTGSYHHCCRATAHVYSHTSLSLPLHHGVWSSLGPCCLYCAQLTRASGERGGHPRTYVRGPLFTTTEYYYTSPAFYDPLPRSGYLPKFAGPFNSCDRFLSFKFWVDSCICVFLTAWFSTQLARNGTLMSADLNAAPRSKLVPRPTNWRSDQWRSDETLISRTKEDGSRKLYFQQALCCILWMDIGGLLLPTIIQHVWDKFPRSCRSI